MERTDVAGTERVAAAYRRVAEVDRPEVWITLRAEAAVAAEAADVDARAAAGGDLPLAGLLVAVKDNIDVAGLPTTAACPEYAFTPDRSAPAVQRLVDAGALVLGKTNLDQFATGLVGTRSPYGAVRAAGHPDRVSGGSSSGSAVAVALGIADVALGTDTAGSGRVPAAFNGLVGVKTTLGLVPTSGVVPACVELDAVSLFAPDLPTARRVLPHLIGPEAGDARSRPWPPDVPLAAPDAPRVAVPRDDDLAPLTPAYRSAFTATVEALAATGAAVETVDVSELLAVARLLYDGAIVAQRYAAVGDFLAGGPAGADPTVAAIVLGAGDIAAVDYVRDSARVVEARRSARALLAGYDALLVPTTTEHPTLEAVAADPLGVNRRLGTYTNFCNLLDMAAVAVPGFGAADGPFGVTLVGPAFTDQVLLDLAARLASAVGHGAVDGGGDPVPDVPPAAVVDGGVELAVFGAHMRGEPLNHQLQDRRARFVGPVVTSDAYRLVALDAAPPKPGLVRHGPGKGAPIAGEVWLVTPHALGTLLAALPAPMSLTPVELDDGRHVVGFGCAHDAAEAGTDITHHGGWRAHLRASEPA